MKANLENTRNQLDKYIEEMLLIYDLPGLGISAKLGEFTYKKTVGFSDYIAKEPLLEKDFFHMASVSKLFVSMAIMKLVEAGKVSLETRVIEILPWIKIADERINQITIKHLLSHTSGLTDVKEYGWNRPRGDQAALKDYVQSREVTESKLLWGPAENKFSYSNIGFEILGCVIREISKMSFEAYIKKNIFIPAGMMASDFLTFKRGEDVLARSKEKKAAQTGEGQEAFPKETQQALPGEGQEAQTGEGQAASPKEPQQALPGEGQEALPKEPRQALPDEDKPNFPIKASLDLDVLKAANAAMPHTKDQNKHIVLEKDYPYNREHGPSSTFTTDLYDIEKWAVANLNQTIVSKDLYKKAWTSVATVPNNGEGIGLGWFVREQNGRTLYGHEGTDDGFRASFWICPKEDSFVAIMANISNAPVKKINRGAFDLLCQMKENLKSE